MPAAVIPKPVFTVQILTHMTEGVASNTLYGIITGVVTGDEDVLAITNAVQAAVAPALAACLSAECEIIEVNGRYRTATNDYRAISSNESVDGLIAGDALPIQDCFELRRITGLAGRAEMGRLFFSGMSEDDVQFGQIKAVRKAALDNLAQTLKNDLTIGDRTVSWRHWSRKANLLSPLTAVYQISRMVSRRDRAKRERYLPMPSA